LLRCFKKAKPSRMKKYASALPFFRALHSYIFDRPVSLIFSTVRFVFSTGDQMKRQKFPFRTVMVALLAALFLASCAKAPRKAASIMDTPEHHYANGVRSLDKGDLLGAVREFNVALELDGDYGPALAGKGLVRAMRGNDRESLTFIEKGRKSAEGEQEEMWVAVSEIRAWTALAGLGKVSAEDLLDETQSVFEDAKDLEKEDPALYYYQGNAYLQALAFDEAEAMFGEAIRLGKGYAQRADARWQLVQDVKRAAPRSYVGKRIALVEKISRAETAALLVEELDVARFYERTGTQGKSAFRAPSKAGGQTADKNAGKLPLDVSGHPLRADVQTVLALGVMGLGAFPDSTFQPKKSLTRAELAFILEDITARASRTPSLVTKFLGQDSPFLDVRPDHPYFNAVMLCVTRGLMAADPRTGEFRPLDPVAGVEAVKAIHTLKEALRVF
jgi:tetratricopeptide (TPR) repeat protein